MSDAGTGVTAPARPPRATIRQVAAAAGVSIATVSRMLNGREDVSEETRRLVQGVARNHGYEPRGRVARSPTGLVGVTMPWTDPAYFAEILSGAAEALYERNSRVVLCPTRHERAREVSLLEQLMHGQTDGALLVLPEESGVELGELSSRGFPYVVVDPLHELDEGTPVVSAANTSGATQAVEHLLPLGHRRIGVITGPPGGVASRGRLRGYHAALAAAGIMRDPALEITGEFLVESGAEGADRLLDLESPPTAIFAFNDSLAIGAAKAARARGIRLPEELSLVGFDDSRDASIAYPPLTTVRQPLAEMGRMAVTLLGRLLDGDAFEGLHVELATRLVVRESTAPPP